MNQIAILESGLQTTIQDRGRIGYQRNGLPVSGVMDNFSYEISNMLVGNNGDEAVLEFLIIGPKIRFNCDCLIAITGGNFMPRINEEKLAMWQCLKVKNGDVLSFKGNRTGCRGYIAFGGGIDVPLVLGSRATYIKGLLGGFQGRPLKVADQLSLGDCKVSMDKQKSKHLGAKWHPSHTNKQTVRVVLGPQNDYFTDKGIETFLESDYAVSNTCDRMGYRLEGKRCEHAKDSDIISDGITFGSVQVPGSGQPIIMMADRQSTGGYPKIATVISSDLWKIAQLKPGESIKFEAISIEEAIGIQVESNFLINEIKNNILNQVVISEKEYKVNVNNKQHRVSVIEIE